MNKKIETTMAKKTTYKRLGDVRNRELTIECLMGINIDKEFYKLIKLQPLLLAKKGR